MRASALVSLRRYQAEQRLRWATVHDSAVERTYAWERLHAAYRYYTGQPLIIAPPTFVAEAETPWTTTPASRTTGSITVIIGDPLVLFAANDATEGGTFDALPTNTNTAQSWTLQREVTTTARVRLKVWTAIASVGQAMTVSLGATTGPHWGMNLLQFRNSDGIGATQKADAADNGPTLSLTTLQANSGVAAFAGDYEAAATDITWPATWTWAKVTTIDDGSNYSIHGGYTLNVGTAAAKTINPVFTGNASPDYSLAAVEVKGGLLRLPLRVLQAVHRAASY